MSTKQQQSTFPSKLYTLLSDDSISDTICWLPHGKSWKILRPSKLADDILPRYFPKLKYASFRRQVNAWGFSRITEGHSQNSYFHKLFMKDRPELVSHIQRPPTAAAKRKNSLQKKNKENDKTTSICTTSVVSTSSDEEGSTTSSSSKQQQKEQQPDRRTSEVEFKAMLSNVEGGHGQQQEELEPCMPVLPKTDFRQTQTSDVELLSFLSTVMKSMNDDSNGKGSSSGNEDLMSTGSSSSSMSSISSCSSLGVPPPPPLNVPSSFFTTTTTTTTGREGQQDIHMVVNESQKEFLCMIQRQKQEINRMLETHSKEMAEYCYAKKHHRDNGNADNDNDNENMSHQGMVSHERNTKEILRNQFCFLSEIEKTVEISSSLALAQQQQDEMMMMMI